MTHYRHLFTTACVGLMVVAGLLLGWTRPLDDALRDFRFSQASRSASGDIVLVRATTPANSDLVSTSRMRSDYAEAIDRLLQFGAERVVLDVNLSTMLGLMDDMVLGDTLRRADGKALTVAYPHGGTRSGSALSLEGLVTPHERFVSAASPVLADRFIDSDGSLRRYRVSTVFEGWVIESLASVLNPGHSLTSNMFLIDFGIAPDTVPRIELADLIAGELDPDHIAGKQVIIGTEDSAMGGAVNVPRYGAVDGTLVQILAAETLRQNRVLTEAGPAPLVILIVVMGCIFWFMRGRLSLGAALLGTVVYLAGLEFIALALHLHSGLLLDTAGAHLAQAGFVFAAFWHEFDIRARSLSATSRERDSMRGILARVVADNFDGVVVVDRSRVIRAASRLAEEIVGRSLRGCDVEDVLPAPFLEVLDAALDDGQVIDSVTETSIAGADGSERTIEYVVTLSSLEGEEVSPESAGRIACLTFRDITERRLVEEKLVFLAEHDALTGALSRHRFLCQIDAHLLTPAAHAEGLRVLLVRLTRLKTVNDTLGHDFGDRLLCQVVSRLGKLQAVCVGRLESDTFGIVVKGRLDDADAHDFAQRVLETVTEPYDLDGHHAIIGAKIGMTDTVLSFYDPQVLVEHAAMALSLASDLPGNAVATFAEQMSQRIKIKQEMEVALRRAIANDEFSVHYQPQVRLDTGEIIGVEALLRWTHPELGNIAPGQFIPTAEETGQIIELGRWVLRRATQEVANWPRPVRLAVNVSPLQFEHGDIVADVLGALEASGLPPERLDVEITESLLITETSQFTAKLEQLRTLGVGVALDDFGTGYSSMSYLGRLPVDKIKIDQSFVRGLPENAESTAIIRAVLMLSESLNKTVIAEGIETVDQAWLLRLLGCKTGQGYHFGRPCAEPELLEKLLEAETDKMVAGSRG